MRGGTGRALTFTLPPESGPNSAILLNILSYGRSRSRQGKRPGPAGSPLPQRPHSSCAGPGGGFLVEGGRVSGVRSPRKRQLLAGDGVPEAHSALLSVRSDLEWAAAAKCAQARRALLHCARAGPLRWVSVDQSRLPGSEEAGNFRSACRRPRPPGFAVTEKLAVRGDTLPSLKRYSSEIMFMISRLLTAFLCVQLAVSGDHRG